MSLQIGSVILNNVTSSKKVPIFEEKIVRRTISGRLRTQYFGERYNYTFTLENIDTDTITLLEDEIRDNGGILICNYNKTGFNIQNNEFFVEIQDYSNTKYNYEDIDGIRHEDLIISLRTTT